MEKPKTPGLATHCIHGQKQKDVFGSPHMPIYDTTTFGFSSTADLLDVIDGRKPGGLYTRYGFNPTITALEETLAGLENAECALSFSAGMAAASALFLTHGRNGIVCVGEAYGGTLELLNQQLPQLGIKTFTVAGNELDRLDVLLKQGVKLVFFETPANPTLSLLDIVDISARAHAQGALVAIDNTFASPVNQKPLDQGADIVMHSATKYLGGHSDLTAGCLMGSKTLLDPVWHWRKNLGTVPAPTTASLLSRSLRTLVVRVQGHNANAQRIAEAMQKHPRIRKVYYPGLTDFPGHELAKKQMSGFGGMLTLEIDGDREQTTRVADRLKLITLAPSLGGTESLVTQPCTTTHHGLSADERARRGISDSMLRFSIGLENAEDLLADLEQALKA